MSDNQMVITADVSQALSAAAKLQAANDAQQAAARALAGLMSEAEKANIAAMRASGNAAKQALADRREQIAAAKAAIAAAREEQQAAVQASRAAQAEDKRRMEMSRQAAAEERAAARAAERANEERIAGFRRATDEADRLSAALRQIDQETRSSAQSASTMGQASASFTSVAGSMGAIVTGFQSAISLGREAVQIASDLANESIEAQNVGANLQVQIGGARDAFKGYVDDVEIARIANMAFELGVIKNGEELENLARGVQAKAERLGVSSTQLFENAVTGIGRQSALILDNLGIILDQTKAEEIYAKSLGKTADQLDALQREEAFQKAALIEIAKAGKTVQSSVDGMAQAWKRGEVAFTNFRKAQLGFSDDAAAVKEALREISFEQLDRLAFGAMADENTSTGRELIAMLGEWGVTLQDVRVEADRLGLTWEELIAKTRSDLGTAAVEESRKAMEATHRELAGLLNEKADSLDHDAELFGVLGKSQSEIIALQIESLELRLEAAEAVKDEAAQLDITRKLELARAKQETKPKSSGGRRRDPNEALDRDTQALLDQLDAKKEIISAEKDLAGSRAETLALDGKILGLEYEALDIRQQAAETRKVKTAADIAKRDGELLDITTERRLLDLGLQKDTREWERSAAEDRVAEMDREIELLDAQGVATGLLQRRRADAQSELLAQYGTAEERAADEHERTVADAEQAIIDRDAKRARALEDFDFEAELIEARGVEYHDAAQDRIALELSMLDAATEGDKIRELHHRRELARIAEEQRKRKAAMDASSQLLTAGAGLFSAITSATIKDEKKREKASLRARGVEAVARGALETVEAVAAFASYRYLAGALHVAAAATAFATGIPMIAGNVPSQGGATAGGVAASAGDYTTDLGAGNSGGSSNGRDLPSTPASAEQLTRLRGGMGPITSGNAPQSSGGTVVHIGTFITPNAGTLHADLREQEAHKWGAA